MIKGKPVALAEKRNRIGEESERDMIRKKAGGTEKEMKDDIGVGWKRKMRRG